MRPSRIQYWDPNKRLIKDPSEGPCEGSGITWVPGSACKSALASRTLISKGPYLLGEAGDLVSSQ